MNKERTKRWPRYIGAAFATWTVLLVLSRYTGGYSQYGGLLDILGIAFCAAVFLAAIATFFRSKASSRGGALRRSIAVLCAGTLTVSLITVPAEATAVEGFAVDGILLDWTYTEGEDPAEGKLPSGYTEAKWELSSEGTSVTGDLTPGSKYKICSGKKGYYSKVGATTTLTIINNSGANASIKFNYTVPDYGTLEIIQHEGTEKEIKKQFTTKGSFESEELGNKGYVKVLLTSTPAITQQVDNSTMPTTSAQLSEFVLKPSEVTLTVKFDEVRVGEGSYTVQSGETFYEIGSTNTAGKDTMYKLEAFPTTNYVFSGWYADGAFFSNENPCEKAFSNSCTVEARFEEEPLFSIVTMSEGNKGDFVEINSAYYHSSTGSSHTNYGDTSANNSYGDATKFPNSPWSAISDTAIQSSSTGRATGDNQTSMGYSRATANIYSDIIRVKCLQNCKITFTASLSAKSMDDTGDANQTSGIYFYYYTAANASANASTITGNGTKLVDGKIQSSGSGTATVTVNAGEYLYLYAYGRTMKSEMTLSGYTTDDYNYAATISNVSIVPNTTVYTFTTGNVDNTGAQLKFGSVKINGMVQSVASGSYTEKKAEGSKLTLTPDKAPTGYVFIGWHNVTDDTYLYTSNRYEVTMSKDYTVYPIYVPVMTITTGGTNGYESASYTYTNLDKETVAPNGQYVARNADCSKFYKNLNEAFSSTDNTVVLLAGDTINGDFTIPGGKTLVIPYDQSDTFAGGTTPTQVTSGGGPGAAFCTVTFNGNLTLDGNLVVNARQSGGSYGRAYGTIGRLNMGASSSITVNSGANLCAFGCISGGNINVKSGGNVYELMDIEDMRALLVMKSVVIDNPGEKVFPFSCFFIKNIEATTTYDSGANLYACMSVLLQGNATNTVANIPVIGKSDSMFNLTAGTLTKKYQSSTDQTIFQINTDAVVSTGKFTLPMSYSDQSMDVNTEDYYVPLCSGYGLQVDGELTFNYYYKMLPGSTINVSSTGNLIVASGSELVLYRGNDFDTRSRGDTSTGYQGYSTGGYPRNSARFTSSGSSYPFSWSAANMGSAKLTVDGTVTVNGALYVTETLAGVNTNDNGYNYLQGTGKIIYSDTSTLEGTMKEARETSTTNDVEFATIALTSVKGLPVAATEDSPGKYENLKKDTYYGVKKGDFYVWATNRMQFFDGDELKYVAATSDGASVVSATDNLITDASGKVTTLADPSSIGRVAMGWKAENGTAAETATQISAKSFNNYGDDVKFYVVYAVAQIMNSSGVVKDTENQPMCYATLQEAVAACGSSTDWYIQMLESVTEYYTISGTVYLDLNGKNVTVNGITGTLYGMDHATNDYGISGASRGTLVLKGDNPGEPEIGTAGTVDKPMPKDTDNIGYAYLRAGGGTAANPYTFNRFAINVTDYYLEVDANGGAKVGFAAAFQGNSTVAAALSNMGMIIIGTNSAEDGTVKIVGSAEEWGNGTTGSFANVTTPYKGYCTIPITSLVDTEQKSVKHYGDYSAKGLLKFEDVIWESRESGKINFKSELETYYKTANANAQGVIEAFRNKHPELGLNLVKQQ